MRIFGYCSSSNGMVVIKRGYGGGEGFWLVYNRNV